MPWRANVASAILSTNRVAKITDRIAEQAVLRSIRCNDHSLHYKILNTGDPECRPDERMLLGKCVNPGYRFHTLRVSQHTTSDAGPVCAKTVCEDAVLGLEFFFEFDTGNDQERTNDQRVKTEDPHKGK